MINEDIVKRLKEDNYSLELENEKLKIMNAKQEKVIKNIHATLRQLAYN
ncbi:hypothetical protein [Clostridium tagluense]|nr:hypothetical protein [Clostridium tagluense]MBW9157216.1 hypothetical protein [Clostridium tagluense]WLC67183.1 hypothetical protein KTC93_08395 [Clostridium tagluense]